MFSLKVLLTVFSIFAILLIIPLSVDVKFREEVDITVKYLFLRFKSNKKGDKDEDTVRKEEEKETSEKNKKKSLSNTVSKTVKEYGISEFIGILKKIAELAVGMLKSLFSHMTIDNVYLNVGISSDNAADTAIKYGQACATILPSVRAITSITNCKKKNIKIKPIFDENNNTKIEFVLKFKIKPIFILKSVIVALFAYFKYILKLKLQKNS